VTAAEWAGRVDDLIMKCCRRCAKRACECDLLVLFGVVTFVVLLAAAVLHFSFRTLDDAGKSAALILLATVPPLLPDPVMAHDAAAPMGVSRLELSPSLSGSVLQDARRRPQLGERAAAQRPAGLGVRILSQPPTLAPAEPASLATPTDLKETAASEPSWSLDAEFGQSPSSVVSV
jgi:hypothetical protein